MRPNMPKLVSSMVLSAICFFALSVQSVSADPCPDLSFENPIYYAAGLTTNSVATGDIDGDGHVDLVAASDGSGAVTIRYGNGDGSFVSSTQLPVTSPSGVAIGDFNRDGIPDIATISRTISRLTIRLGLGGGAFDVPVQTQVGSSPAGIALGDFNGDGNIDIVTANGGNGTVSLLLGNAAGSFPVATSFSPRGSGSFDVVTGDFNADGLLDLATANRGSGNMSVMLGDGTGGFSPGTVYTTGSLANKIASADLNGDGAPDLVTANQGSGNLSVRFNNGLGSFSTGFNLLSGAQTFAVAVGDVDDDGDNDLIATVRSNNSVLVYRGNGDGTFTEFGGLSVDAGPRAVLAADLNGDEMLDITAAVDNSAVGVFLNGCVFNTAPTITASSVTRRQDAGISTSEIATVADGEDELDELIVTIDGGGTATVNGVTVSNIAVSSTGSVTADVGASCGASDASFTLSVSDDEGLTSTATLNVDVTNETTPPVIGNGMPIPDITVYLPLNSPDVSMPVLFDLPTATDNCSEIITVTSSPESSSVFGLGSTVVVITAVDELENTSTATFRVNVLFNFGGLQAPIEAFPMLNISNAGGSIPVKFSLSGDKGLGILAEGYPASSPVGCNDNEPGTIIEETDTAGGSGLSYEAGADQYKYIWKTSKDWKRSCRILILRFKDGTEQYAKFSFR